MLIKTIVKLEENTKKIILWGKKNKTNLILAAGISQKHSSIKYIFFLLIFIKFSVLAGVEG